MQDSKPLTSSATYDEAAGSGYFVEFKRGTWAKPAAFAPAAFEKGPAIYHGSVTEAQAVELERIVSDFLDGKTTPSETPLKSRDWTEDADHENGKYSCWCTSCESAFIGHKRRTTCKLCALSAIPRRLTVETFDGDEPAVACGISWIIRNHDGQPDHACATCVRGADSIIDGFTCYYHQALELKAEHG